MKKQAFLLLLFSAFLCIISFAQTSEIIKNYINTYKDIAIAEMQRTGVPAAITLAQGIHETGAGTSDLVRRSNNHFGIKCKSDWKGESVSHDDDARGECFRKYNDPFESYRDHSDFLKYRPYYAALFKLDPTDFEGWAYGLKKAGYATNPRYPQILIKLIKDYQLQDYTLIALNNKSVDELVWKQNEEMEIVLDREELPEEIPVITKEYPSGIFRINETKVIYASKGTSFLKIASDH
ncbi:MAG: glycoside hydrolase family 73 protein, partial [Flavisolibacter sp.]